MAVISRAPPEEGLLTLLDDLPLLLALLFARSAARSCRAGEQPEAGGHMGGVAEGWACVPINDSWPEP
jgi:hypothetical protein